LRKKKNISLIDIIQLPHLYRLIDASSYGRGDAQKIKDKNNEMILEIAKHIGKQDIKIGDLSGIDLSVLKSILAKYQIKNNDKIASDIIKNSQFWSKF
jgi:hypothetical protein